MDAPLPISEIREFDRFSFDFMSGLSDSDILTRGDFSPRALDLGVAEPVSLSAPVGAGESSPTPFLVWDSMSLSMSTTSSTFVADLFKKLTRLLTAFGLVPPRIPLAWNESRLLPRRELWSRASSFFSCIL